MTCEKSVPGAQVACLSLDVSCEYKHSSNAAFVLVIVWNLASKVPPEDLILSQDVLSFCIRLSGRERGSAPLWEQSLKLEVVACHCKAGLEVLHSTAAFATGSQRFYPYFSSIPRRAARSSRLRHITSYSSGLIESRSRYS